jgi:endonuclease V-like protein UPF0215 family
VKAGARALGVAESYRGTHSTVVGALVRASRVVDDIAVSTCTVGGTDATGAIRDLWDALDREDVQYLIIAGIAPAWYNVVDLHAVAEATDRPTISVSFQDSPGLAAAIRTEFDDPAAAERLDTYRAQPERHRVSLDGETVFVRTVGLEAADAADVVRGFTPQGGRPEPLRVARLAARAVDAFRTADG